MGGQQSDERSSDEPSRQARLVEVKIWPSSLTCLLTVLTFTTEGVLALYLGMRGIVLWS